MSRKITLIILTVLCAVAVAGYLYFFISLRNLNAEIRAIDAEIESEDEKEAALRLAGSSLEETENERKTLESFFVGQDGPIAFIEGLEKVAKKNNVDISIDSLGVEALPTETTEKLSARINVEGTFPNVYRFLIEMENTPLAFEFGRVLLFKPEESEKSSLWGMQANFSVLKLK